MKPHIRRYGGYWLCAGASVIGYGITVESAYMQWQAVAVKLAVADDVFADMTETLSLWEPKGMAQ